MQSEILYGQPTARKLQRCTYRLLAESEACLLTRKFAKERVTDVFTPLNSHSSCVCRYQVEQMLERQKVQRIAFGRLAASVCLVTAVSCVTKCTMQMLY